MIVIIAACDMRRQEFSLCERVYIHSTICNVNNFVALCTDDIDSLLQFPVINVLEILGGML